MDPNYQEEIDMIDENRIVMPLWFRLITSLVGIGLVGPGIVFICRYASNPEGLISPADIGVVPLITIGAAILLIGCAPWAALGLRVRKVGFVEFDRVVNTQAREHVQEFAELRARIEELEGRIRSMDSVGPIVDHFAEIDLIPLLVKFLEEFRPKAFSPLKIRQWGARQPGYEKFASYAQGQIRSVLQKLVAQGEATTRVSKLGNTLYCRMG